MKKMKTFHMLTTIGCYRLIHRVEGYVYGINRISVHLFICQHRTPHTKTHFPKKGSFSDQNRTEKCTIFCTVPVSSSKSTHQKPLSTHHQKSTHHLSQCSLKYLKFIRAGVLSNRSYVQLCSCLIIRFLEKENLRTLSTLHPL